MVTSAAQLPDTATTRAPRSVAHAATALAWAVTVGLTTAALLGLAIPDLYGDSSAIVPMMRGYDIVTLVAAVPVLLLSLAGPLGGSPRAGLLRVGGLVYALYSCALAALGLGFTPAFLLHVAVTAAALAALPLTLLGEDTRPTLAAWFPRRAVAAVLAVLAAGLGGMWAAEAMRSARTGVEPAGSALVEPTPLVQVGIVLDLVLLVPAYALAAALLWRRSRAAPAAAAAVLVSGTLHQLGYLAALAAQLSADVPGATWDTVEPVIATVFLASTVALLGAARRRPGPGLEHLARSAG